MTSWARLLEMPSSATRAWNGRNEARNGFGRRASSTASTNRVTARSYSSSGLSQLGWTFGSPGALHLVGADPLAEGGVAGRVAREGPRAHERLVEVILHVPIRCEHAL